MWVTEILIAVFLLLLFVFFKDRRRRMSVLQRNGINVPSTHWIWGNVKHCMVLPNVLWDTMLTNRYGSICGYYFGAKPVVLVTELSLLEKIQGCEGDHFLDRPRRVPGGISPDPKRARMLGNLNVLEWRALRAILSRGFAPAKLGTMYSDARRIVAVFVSIIGSVDARDRSTPIDFYELYQNLTLDLIGKTGFGLDSDIQRNPNDALKAAVKQEFSKSTSSFLLKFYLCFPELQGILQPIRVWLEGLKQRCGFGGRSELWDLGLSTVSQRKQHGSTESPSDLLQIMISSEKLTDISIVANSVLFFEAGFETLSASLAFITHLLMNHMDIQNDVREEIREFFAQKGEEPLKITDLPKFTFLDAVIKEGLRMFPPQTTFIGRSGEKDITTNYRAADGTTQQCTIPRNTHIQVGLYQILNSNLIWEAPREFRPNRFLTELTKDQNIAYQPFGKGKRVCIGKKYADMILKLVLIELLRRYKVVPVEEHPTGGFTEIEIEYKTATMTPKNGVYGHAVEDPLTTI